ncbi:uncharacterized protein LOC126584232 [Malus sylvestris]|uniref:uncharacterized protein LOC126584232 n=1 Tax=Malus sylvestris TaxID=3752 RepID=UPI0021AD1949|nr:uncharacterized protein LOC126584232 [Malus sylvestris]
MDVDSYAPQVPEDEELQLGQIYFLMPLSQTKSSLSLQDLCSLAIKASAALANPLNARRVASSGRSPASDRNGQNVGACKVPTGIDIVGMETRFFGDDDGHRSSKEEDREYSNSVRTMSPRREPRHSAEPSFLDIAQLGEAIANAIQS